MKSAFPDTKSHRSFYDGFHGYLQTPNEPNPQAKSLEALSAEYPKLIHHLISLWLQDNSLLSVIERDWAKEVTLVGGMIQKILSGKHLGKKDRRKVRIILQRQVNHNTRDLFESTTALLPIIDNAEGQAMKLLEQGIIRAFHDLTQADYVIPNFESFPGSIEHLNISHKYGTLRGYVPPIGDFRKNSDFIYTDSWVIDGQWNPLFPLNKDARESFNHSSSGYIGTGIFLVFQDKGNYQYQWKVKNIRGEVLEEFDAGTVEHLGNGVLFPSKDQHWHGTFGLYDARGYEYILRGEYTLHDFDSKRCILQSSDTKKYGIFDFVARKWDVSCEKEKCEKIRMIKTEGDTMNGSWYIQDGDGTEGIFDSDDGTTHQVPSTMFWKFRGVSVFTESEKYRYLWATREEGTKISKVYIISADGKNIIGPFSSCVQRNEIGATFVKNENKEFYTYLDFTSGETKDIMIPGEISSSSEGFYNAYIISQEEKWYGVKDFQGNILVAPQEFPIEGYYPKSQFLHLSREVIKPNSSEWKEEAEKEYQLIDMRGNVLFPWDTKLSNIRYVDVGIFSTDRGKLICSTESATIIRDIPEGWVTVKKTARKGIYIIDEDWDRGWHHYTLFNAYEDTVFVRGEWLPWDPEQFRHNYKSNALVLSNGNIIYGNGLVDPDGKMILPLGISGISTSPFYNNEGNEIWVICRYRNSLMKAIFWEKS